MGKGPEVSMQDAWRGETGYSNPWKGLQGLARGHQGGSLGSEVMSLTVIYFRQCFLCVYVCVHVWGCVYISARCECVLSREVMSYSLRLHGLYHARLLCPWDFPDKSTKVGCHLLL